LGFLITIVGGAKLYHVSFLFIERYNCTSERLWKYVSIPLT
jgi:hypothetical protein